MKLVNVQVIKDELERLIRDYRFYSSAEAKYRCEAYRELSEWLDGLEVEEPSNDLEEEIKETLNQKYGFKVTEGCDIWFTRQYQEDFARLSHIAKWQEEQITRDSYERVVKVDAGGYPYIDATELYDYDKDVPLAKAGDKVKVLIVKDK